MLETTKCKGEFNLMINLLKPFNIKFIITIIVCIITLGALSGCFGKKKTLIAFQLQK